MGIGQFLLDREKSLALRRAALAGLITGAITVAGCASYPGLRGLTEQTTAYDAAAETPTDPAQASAVADIRARAEAAATNDDGVFPNVFQSFGPDGSSTITRAERLAVEAELDAVLAAQARATNPAEAQRLKARAALLKQLAQNHRVQAEADIQAASKAAN